MTDTLLFNGRIATLDPANPTASAVAIERGQFTAVGEDQAVMARRDSGTVLIDLQGRTVIPGLNDSHMHVIRGGLNYNMELRWDGVRSLADAMAMLRAQVAAHAAAAMGARGRRLDRVPVRREAPADARGDQRGRAGHAGLHPASL